MRDLNKIILRGTVADPPRVKDSGGKRRVGLVVKTVTLESREDGGSQEQTTFHRVSAEGENAQPAERLRTGDAVYVEGRLQTRKFRDRRGYEMQATGVLASLVQPVDTPEPQRNRSLILGNVGGRPRLRNLRTTSVASLRVPTSSGWPPPPGEREETEWHSVEMFGTLAEQLGPKLDKGQRVLVAGYVQSRKYIAHDGSERRSTETVAHTVISSEGTGEPAFPSGSGTDDGSSPGFKDELRNTRDDEFGDRRQGYDSQPSSGVATDSEDDDIPF